MEHGFLNEVEAYKRLHSLQGHKIPRCYGSGALILPNRAFFPRILLLQFILDTVNLRHITVKPNQSLITSLIETASTFGALGITHNDLHPGNILFTPRTAPTLAFIIDFGCAYFREEEDEEWDETRDVGTVSRALTFWLAKGRKLVSLVMRGFFNGQLVDRFLSSHRNLKDLSVWPYGVRQHILNSLDVMIQSFRGRLSFLADLIPFKHLKSLDVANLDWEVPQMLEVLMQLSRH
jgi:hypothetical protein